MHLLTHDVQLPAMMCNYTFYTYKINALEVVHHWLSLSTFKADVISILMT